MTIQAELKQFEDISCNTVQKMQNAEIQTSTTQVGEKACETEQDQDSGNRAGTHEISTENPQKETMDSFRGKKKEQADFIRKLCEEMRSPTFKW